MNLPNYILSIFSNPIQQSAHFKQLLHKLIDELSGKLLSHRAQFFSFINLLYYYNDLLILFQKYIYIPEQKLTPPDFNVIF